MSPLPDRLKLDTTVEREVHKYTRQIRERTYDSVMLYTRRQNIEIDPVLLEAVLDAVKLAIDESALNNMNSLFANIKTAVDHYSAEVANSTELPFTRTTQPKHSKQPQTAPTQEQLPLKSSS